MSVKLWKSGHIVKLWISWYPAAISWISILIRFSDLGDLSDEQGERFHEDLKTMKERHQERWDKHVVADYCWSIKQDCPEEVHRRKSKRKFLPE